MLASHVVMQAGFLHTWTAWRFWLTGRNSFGTEQMASHLRVDLTCSDEEAIRRPLRWPNERLHYSRSSMVGASRAWNVSGMSGKKKELLIIPASS